MASAVTESASASVPATSKTGLDDSQTSVPTVSVTSTPSRSHSNSNATFGKRDDDQLDADSSSAAAVTTTKTESNGQNTSASHAPQSSTQAAAGSKPKEQSSVQSTSPVTPATNQPILRPFKTKAAPDGDAQWGANFWVTLVEPQSQTPFYACPATGQVSWDPPVGNFVLPKCEEGEWWELSDESRGGIPYYYHTKTNETVWERPDEFVIPLGILQNTALTRRLSLNMGKRQSIIADLQPPDSKPEKASVRPGSSMSQSHPNAQSQLPRPSNRRAQSSHGIDRHAHPSAYVSGREKGTAKRVNTADQYNGKGQFATIGASTGNINGRHPVRRAISNEQYSTFASSMGNGSGAVRDMPGHSHSHTGHSGHVNHPSHGSAAMRPALTPIPGSPYATDASVSPPSSPSRSIMSIPSIDEAKRKEKGKGREVFNASEITSQSSPRAPGVNGHHKREMGKGHPSTHSGRNGNAHGHIQYNGQEVSAYQRSVSANVLPSPSRAKSSYNAVPAQSLDAAAEFLAQSNSSSSSGRTPAASPSRITPPRRALSDNQHTTTTPNTTPSANLNHITAKKGTLVPNLQITISTTTTTTSSPTTSSIGSPSKFHTPLPSPLEISIDAKGGLGFVPRSPSLDSRRSRNADRDKINVPPSPRFPMPSTPTDTQTRKKLLRPSTPNGTHAPITTSDISNPVLNLEATRNLSPVKARAQGKPILLEPQPKSVHGSVSPQATNALETDRPVLPEDLASDIQQFVQTEFARQYFTIHRSGIIFRRKIPVEKLMTWQKAPLTHPLLVMNKTLHKDAVKIFKVIQRLMGDRERDKPIGIRPQTQQNPQLQQLESYASSPLNTSQVSLPSASFSIFEEERWLLEEGLTHGELRDEIYCQLIKQLTGNPSSESIFRGWQVLCVLLVTFPPSKNFEAYLHGFMEQHVPITTGRVDVMAKYCIQRLSIISKKGPRGKPLSIAEIETASDAAFNPSTFGESLDAVFRLQERMYPHLQVPIILPFLADGILALGGTRSEGIFRIPGDGDLISSLKLRIERGYYNMEGIDDPHVPASLLKLWLRELCSPLIPDELYNDCVSCSGDSEACVHMVSRLPTTNRRVVLFIISFLQLFLDEKIQSVTKMTSANLALVMAPNLLRCNSESMTVVFTNAQFEQAFVHNLLVHLKCNKVDPLYVPKHGLGSMGPPTVAPRKSKAYNARRAPS